ncbi:SLC13 family permease [soil metagenome]
METPPFTFEVGLTLAITAGALVLFMWDRVRADVVGLIVMAALIVSGLVTPQQGISGFSNEAMITVAAMFILSAGLSRTGAIDRVGRLVGRFAGKSEIRLLLASIAIAVPLSAFINNTPVVVMMIPMLLGLAKEMGVAPSRLLIPVSFGSQMGGTLTLIGTSTNLLVAGLVLDLGMDRIRLFDVTPPALVLTSLGLLYLLTIGRKLTPTRETQDDLVASYELREYLTGLIVDPDSPLIGRSLSDSRFGAEYGLQVVGIEREDSRIPFPRGDTVLLSGDHLLVRGKSPEIARIEEASGLRLATGQPTMNLEEMQPKVANDREPRLAELIVPPRSHVIGRTLQVLNFRSRFGVPVLAVQRHGEPLHESLRDTRLAAGDVLLVRGTPEELQRLHRDRDLALLGAVDIPPRRVRKMKVAIGIMVAVVLLAAFDITTILVSSILGVVAMFLTRCMTPDEAYEDIDWMVLVLLGSIIPLGLAMQNTGTAQILAAGLLGVTEPLGLYGSLAALYLLTSLLTEVISNNAAAVVLTPVAVAAAVGLGASPLPFVIALMFAASNSFLTPIGYQTNTFIYGPGGYRFSDFARVGGPLMILMLIAATFTIPFFFPFAGR